MKKVTEKQGRLIYATDPAEFEQKLNKTISGLADPEVKVMPEYAPAFCALVFVPWDRYEAETPLEEAEEKHGCFHCGDCAMLSRTTDKRITRHECQRHGGKCKADTPACMEFYQDLERMEHGQERMAKGNQESTN